MNNRASQGTLNSLDDMLQDLEAIAAQATNKSPQRQNVTPQSVKKDGGSNVHKTPNAQNAASLDDMLQDLDAAAARAAPPKKQQNVTPQPAVAHTKQQNVTSSDNLDDLLEGIDAAAPIKCRNDKIASYHNQRTVNTSQRGIH